MVCSCKQSIAQPLFKGLTLDKTYYLPNADLHFQVEQTIFRVHSYFFLRESHHFRERMAGVDCARSGAHDGATDKTAIPVKNTTTEEFSHFLWVFYDPSYLYSASASVWRDILTLSASTRWDFPKINALALRHLKDLPFHVVERIVLYKSCSVSFIDLLPLFMELCTRTECLTLQESICLGWELVVPIWEIRERLLRGEGKGGPDDDTIISFGGVGERVSREWLQDVIKSTLDITQDICSVRGLKENHKFSPQYESSSQPKLPILQSQENTSSAQRISIRASGSKCSSLTSKTRSLQACPTTCSQQDRCISFGRDSGYIIIEKSVVEEYYVFPGSWV